MKNGNGITVNGLRFDAVTSKRIIWCKLRRALEWCGKSQKKAHGVSIRFNESEIRFLISEFKNA